MGAHCLGCRINPPWEPLLWWCQVHGSCCCVCLPWVKERRWSSRRNGDLLSSYGQTNPPFSVPKQHPCPCRASHLELGKPRVADRAREGSGQLLTLVRLKSTTVCAVPSAGWILLPAWVTKGISEGSRAGKPQLAHGGGSRSPRRALCGQSCALPTPSDPAWGEHSAHGSPQCPSVRPSGTAAGQGRLVGCYGACVCCSFDDHERNFYITFKRAPLGLLLYF